MQKGIPGDSLQLLSVVSLDPPLVLFCIDTSADSYNAFVNGCYFAVNILSDQQRGLSQLFATKGNTKYQSVEFEEGQTGTPLLSNCLAYLECSIYASYPGGDHRIIVGFVKHRQVGQQYNTRPLLSICVVMVHLFRCEQPLNATSSELRR